MRRRLLVSPLGWPTLSVLCAVLVLASACGQATSASTGTAQGAAIRPARLLMARAVSAPHVTTAVQTARRHLYRFSTTNVGLMQLAVDAQGMVWAGEMNANRLGRFDTHTGVVTTWTPPDAQYGIMTTVIDASGNVWFAEQNANYIGRFDPGSQVFHLFPLGTLNGSQLGPQDLYFDARGMLWFTASLAGAIGRLDPSTGAIRLWPVPSPGPAIPSSPTGITVAPNGVVWFGDYDGGAFGRLDPNTGQVTLYRLPDAQTQIFALAADTGGRLWFTEVLPGRLGEFDPATGTLTELAVPAITGGTPALYGLVIDRQGNIWFVDVGADMLVRYSSDKQVLTFFRLSLPSSAPSSLVLDPAGNLWFTAGGAPDNYVGEIMP